jgi:phage anti-repressor protein
MSLTVYLKNKLGITHKEASLVEKEVKSFTTSLKESYGKKKIKESKRRFREEDEPIEDISMEDDSIEDIDIDNIGEEDIEDMGSSGNLVNGHYPDNEVEMIKIQLKSIVSNAESLMNTLDSEQNLDAWIQSKITLAQDYLAAAHDYIVYSDTYADEEGMPAESDMPEDDMSMDEEPTQELPPMEEEPVTQESDSLPAEEEAPAIEEPSANKESFKYGFVSF